MLNFTYFLEPNKLIVEVGFCALSHKRGLSRSFLLRFFCVKERPIQQGV